MSQKRREKLDKLKKKRIKQANKARKAEPMPAKAILRISQSSYPTEEACEADVALLEHAWREHFGEVGEGFAPPMLDSARTDGTYLAPWVATFRDSMFDRHRGVDKEVVEQRIKFHLLRLWKSMLE